MQQIPAWIEKYLDSDHADQVEEAIRKAEDKTSGEIVPIVVRRSSTIGHVPMTLLGGIVFLAYFGGLDTWRSHLWGEESWWLLIIDFAVAFLLVRLLSPLEVFHRWLTPKRDQEVQVMERAQLEFYESSMHKTEGATGILLFVSLMERQAVVLADKSISDKMPPETWSNVIEKLIGGVKNQDFTKGLVDSISLCGEILEKEFPIQPGDVNELPNHLIIKE